MTQFRSLRAGTIKSRLDIFLLSIYRMVCIVSVIDSRNPILFKHFLSHYQKLGFEYFYCCFHSAKTEMTESLEQCLELFHDHAKGIYQLWQGEDFSSYKKWRIRTLLSGMAKEDGHFWQAFVDCDEFYLLDTDLDTFLIRLEKYHAVRAVLVDRLAPSGFPILQENESLFAQFPLNAFVTNDLLKAIVSKIFLHHSDILMRCVGHHYIATAKELQIYPQWLSCYHFKWDASCIERLKERIAVFQRKKIHWWRESDRFVQNPGQCWDYLAEPQEGIIRKQVFIYPCATNCRGREEDRQSIEVELELKIYP